VRQWQQSAR